MKEIKIDRIIRSKRKTISLVLTPDARLVVYSPLTTPLHYIENLVLKKCSWIRKKQDILRERCKRSPPKQFVNGETFLFLGKAYPLRFVEDGADISLEDGLMVSKHLLLHIKQSLIDWYKKQATITITERVNRYAKITGLKYKAVRITDASRRLGSCGHRGTLNFSWRLIMAPPDIIDYVVVHELSHLEQMNHSARFWNKVKTILPDYVQKKKWLKENHYLLDI